MIGITIEETGPLFNGQASAAITDFTNELKKQIAEEGQKDVKAQLGMVLKNPTGYYEGHIQTTNLSNAYSINDSDVIYGAWLEGVGRRNSTTRFKGYATFRKMAQTLDRKVEAIANRVLQHFIGRMN